MRLMIWCFFRYDPITDTWTPLANSMATRRIGVGVAVVNRLLYAVGGFDGANRLRSVECYTPESDEWKFVAPMNTMRSGAGTTFNLTTKCDKFSFPNLVPGSVMR